jgi:hypothetical protein
LYNLQHQDYDNNLVKDKCWKEIAREWQGSGRVAALEWDGMCESAFTLTHSVLLTKFLHNTNTSLLFTNHFSNMHEQ